MMDALTLMTGQELEIKMRRERVLAEEGFCPGPCEDCQDQLRAGQLPKDLLLSGLDILLGRRKLSDW